MPEIPDNTLLDAAIAMAKQYSTLTAEQLRAEIATWNPQVYYLLVARQRLRSGPVDVLGDVFKLSRLATASLGTSGEEMYKRIYVIVFSEESVVQRIAAELGRYVKED